MKVRRLTLFQINLTYLRGGTAGAQSSVVTFDLISFAAETGTDLAIHFSSAALQRRVRSQKGRGLIMNAAEQTTTESFNNGYYRGLMARIEFYAGFDVPMDIAWDTLAKDIDAETAHEAIPKIYFEPLIKAFQTLKTNSNIIEEKLRRIVIKNETNKGATFAGGVLTVDFATNKSADNTDERAQAIVQAVVRSK
jgi:hypothetical protein